MSTMIQAMLLPSGCNQTAGGPGCVLIDAQTRWLAVGEKANAVEACVPHAFDNLVRRAGDHVTPIAGELHGRGKQRRRELDRG
jgi:hypothetical protein